MPVSETFNMTSLLGRRVVPAAIFGACIAGLGTIATAGSDKTEATSRTPFKEIEWEKQPSGRIMAKVSGDFQTGSHIKFIKFPAGATTPLHTHSYGYVGIVVMGTARHYESNKPETETILAAGSHWSISANVPHISECLPGADCIFVTQSDGPFDANLVPSTDD